MSVSLAWFMKRAKLVVTNSSFFLTCVHHAFTYSFSFPFDMHLLEGKHAFHLCLPCFYIMLYMCLP